MNSFNQLLFALMCCACFVASFLAGWSLIRKRPPRR
jgi:hypothetical protein